MRLMDRMHMVDAVDDLFGIVHRAFLFASCISYSFFLTALILPSSFKVACRSVVLIDSFASIAGHSRRLEQFLSSIYCQDFE